VVTDDSGDNRQLAEMTGRRVSHHVASMRSSVVRL
jgi:hypothetical protein